MWDILKAALTKLQKLVDDTFLRALAIVGVVDQTIEAYPSLNYQIHILNTPLFFKKKQLLTGSIAIGPVGKNLCQAVLLGRVGSSFNVATTP